MSGGYWKKPEAKERGERQAPSKKPLETVEQIKGYPYLVNPQRGIRPEIYKMLGFRMKVDEVDGVTPVAAYYPLLKKGKLVAYKKRDYLVPKKHAFSIIGQADVTCDLVGAHKLKSGKRIYITEGEEDLAAAWQAQYDEIQANPKFAGKFHPNVVSVGHGAAYAAEHISNNLDVVNRYEMIVTCYDSDKASRAAYNHGERKGYEATCETHLLLGFDRCKYLPMDLKDPSEYMQAGKGKELGQLLAWGYQDFTPITIESGDEFTVDELLEPLRPGEDIRSLPKTSAIIKGLRDYEMTLVIAPPKSGKSTISKQIAKDIMDDTSTTHKVGHIFLEESGKKTRQSFIALDNNVPLAAFRENPGILTREQVQASYDKLYASGKNLFLNTKEGKLKPEQVVSNMKYMYAKGCRRIILDHLSMVVSGSDNTNERKEIDNLLTEMAAFCESHPVHVLVVAHIRRIEDNPPLDDEKNIIYPYFRNVNVEHARGSSAFEQLFWNAICLEPEILDDEDNIGRVRTKVAFCREWGTRGVGDYLIWDKKTGQLVVCD
jgi:hypothetical protein